MRLKVTCQNDTASQAVSLTLGYDASKPDQLRSIADSKGNAIVYTYTTGRATREERYTGFTSLASPGTRVGDATWRTRLSADLLGLFASVALLLAAVGLYGVMSQAVAQRTREIGIRLALGAGRDTIFTLVIGRAVLMSLTGIVVGVALSLLSMRFLDALLYQVEPNDPVTLGGLAAVLLTVALLASYVPARRAMKVDPMIALRSE